jgi:voltage-gated potassium channel Kch
MNLGGLQPINPELGRTISYGITDEAPALKLIGFDDRLAIEHIVEAGANITEVEKFISRQSQALVMTEVEGFGILDQFSTGVLNINA